MFRVQNIPDIILMKIIAGIWRDLRKYVLPSKIFISNELASPHYENKVLDLLILRLTDPTLRKLRTSQ